MSIRSILPIDRLTHVDWKALSIVVIGQRRVLHLSNYARLQSSARSSKVSGCFYAHGIFLLLQQAPRMSLVHSTIVGHFDAVTSSAQADGALTRSILPLRSCCLQNSHHTWWSAFSFAMDMLMGRSVIRDDEDVSALLRRHWIWALSISSSAR